MGFSVANFRSFASSQFCSFQASFDKAHAVTHCIPTGLKALPRVIRTAAIFGPNASGKSNFLLALRTMRDLVVHSASYTDIQFAEAFTPFTPQEVEWSATQFGVDLVLGNGRYRYTFSYDSQRIRSENLTVQHGRKSQRWFGRLSDENGVERWTPFSASLTGPRETWRKATHSRALFLTTAAREGASDLREVLHWFEHELAIVFPGDDTDPSAFAERLRERQFKKRVLGVLQTVDLQIDDIRLAKGLGSDAVSPLPVEGPGRSTHVANVEFLHRRKGKPAVWLSFAHEAAGVRRLVSVLGPLLHAIETGGLVAIDALDSTLHPLVARFVIQLINDPQISDHGAQLIITSPGAQLMDLDILRRDEIWLMQLNESYASCLAALSQQRPRKGERVAKNYLLGHFGATPVISPGKWRNVLGRKQTDSQVRD